MKSGVCSKCESDEIYLRKLDWHTKNTLGITWNGTTPLETYICGECGYFENYIVEEFDISRIKIELPRVDDMKRKNDEY
jgi:hypothetical protein